MSRAAALASLVVIALVVAEAWPSYNVTQLNVTVYLNSSTTAHVTELLTVMVSNESYVQYNTSRLARNLTLSEWQVLIGPLLTQHLLNPRTGISSFSFIPSPITPHYGYGIADMLLTYNVQNVTFINQTGPRTFLYRFNPAVFNFNPSASGQILMPNTNLTIVLPRGAVIDKVSPIPDSPASAFSHGYVNVTSFSWFRQEPLSKFALSFTIIESPQQEVADFFGSIYAALGPLTYVIIAVVVILFILYTYFRS